MIQNKIEFLKMSYIMEANLVKLIIDKVFLKKSHKSAPQGHSFWQQTQFLQNILIPENDKIIFKSNLQPSSQVNKEL